MSIVASDAPRAALARLIDYAGPFPPARLPIPDAAVEYERVLAGPYGWLVGRFACPAPALLDLATALRSPSVVPITAILTAPDGDWTSGVVDQAQRAASSASSVEHLRLEALEVALPAGPVDPRALGAAIARITALHVFQDVFFEVVTPAASAEERQPLLEQALDAVAASGAGAKLRFGGLTADAVPSTGFVAAFLVACVHRGLRVKGTAGLHRPLRGFDGNLGVTTHGFLNVLAAAALALEGERQDEVERAIAEEDHDALTLGPGALRWRNRAFSPRQVERARRDLFTGMGSCSVDEPAAHLRRMRVLAP